jgi:O-antigen ligase
MAMIFSPASVIRRWALSAFLVTVFIPLAWWTDYWHRSAYEAMAPRFQYLAAGIMLVLAMVSINWFPRRPPIIPFALAFWAVFSMLWSFFPLGSGIRGLVFVIYIMAVIGLLRSPDFEKATLRTAIVSYAGIVVLAVILGPEPRTVGGINPNSIGSFGLGATFLLAMSGRLRWWWIVLVTALLLYTQSRTFLITWGLFLTLGPLTLFLAKRGIEPLVTIVFTLFAMPGVTLFYGQIVQWLIDFSKLIGVSGQKRLTSTFTDRTEYWGAGWRHFQEQPLIGFGYATRQNKAELLGGDVINAHSGIINLLLDLGMVGFGLLLLWYFAALWKSATGVRGWDRSLTTTNAVILIAFIPSLIAQPTYLNLYDPSSMTLLFALCLPFVPRPIHAGRSVEVRPAWAAHPLPATS